MSRKSPATAGLVKSLSRSSPLTVRGIRDRAIILLGFAGALRRSELVALNVADIDTTEHGLLVRISRSKTDQEAEGAAVAIPSGSSECPAEALLTWLTVAQIMEGPVFRAISKSGKISRSSLSAHSVSTIVKRSVHRIGLNEKKFSAHSLRSGFLTSAAANGASIFKMMDVSRHKSIDTLRTYIRDAELFKDHAGLGLL